MRETNVSGQRGVSGFVVQVMTDMREECAFGRDLFNQFDGSCKMGVAGVRLAPQRVEHKDVEPFEQRKALRWDVAHIREVCGGAEAVAGDGVAAMRDGHADKLCTEQVNRRTGSGIETMNLDAGARGVTVDLAEGVLEDAFDDLSRKVIRIECDTFGFAEAQGAQVIHAEDVVGVAVRIEHSIDAVDAFSDGLSMEVRAGVDQDVVSAVIDHDRRSCAAIGRTRNHG